MVAALKTYSRDEVGPLSILSDAKGAYGLMMDNARTPSTQYILRPDRIEEINDDYLYIPRTLHPIPSMVAPFRHTLEGVIARELGELLQVRAGFTQKREAKFEWWATTKEQQAKNRRTYHTLKRSGVRIANSMIGRLIEEAACKESLTLARRFRLGDRWPIYRAISNSARARQLAITFPALAVAIYDGWRIEKARAAEASKMVERGARLHCIASFVGVPYALRMVKPAVASAALGCTDILKDREHLVYSSLPAELWKQRIWLRSIQAAERYGPPFIEWVARNVAEIEGRILMGVVQQVENLSDWVKASYRAEVLEIPDYKLRAMLGNSFAPGLHEGNENAGAQYVTRQFSPDMSLATVQQLSDEWHEAVANHQETSADTRPFAEPWVKGATVNGYSVEPIRSAPELYREGNKMRHCVSTLAGEVYNLSCYFYSVSRDGNKVATVQIIDHQGKPALSHVRGPCNATVSQELMRALRIWLRKAKDIQMPEHETPGRDGWTPTLVNNQTDPAINDEIPF